ncbi:MAG: AraC family transcriptional regulator [Pseudonocardiales bacterium]|jgi:AraC family transcriptional regulator of adaptative response / DNA-3-methyladenine glycosylase II|nr:AraC family transcriptional regulator [Pseudonocardiales bacterium]
MTSTSEYGQSLSGRARNLSSMTTYSAVVTTGIYCRPGCSAKPLAENVRTFTLAAAAEAAGFRACLRCRPYRVAGPIAADSPELVCRAVQLIINGVLDDGTEAELGRRLAVSSRHLRRQFHDRLGVTPDQLARSRRAHFARRLLDDTDVTVAEAAFASGFGSVRQFNRAMREVFRAPPQELRRRRRRTDRLATDGGLTMRLPFAPPFDWDAMLAFLAARSVPGVESVRDDVYRRTISLDGAPGVLEVRLGGPDHLLLNAHLPYWEGLIHVVERIGQVFGVDADIDPERAHSGPRGPGAWGPFEIGVHAVLAQSGGLAEVQTWMGELVQRHGQPVPGLTSGLTHLFPSADTLADSELASDALPLSAAAVVRSFAQAVTDGQIQLDGTPSFAALVTAMTSVPGVGEPAAQQIALRLGAYAR